MEVFNGATYERLLRTLSTYAGRDKFIRILYFDLLLLANRSNEKFAQSIMALVKQLGTARMIFRQFNHFGMVKASLESISVANRSVDPLDHALGSSIINIYTVYGFAEAVAWIGDAKIIAVDSAKYYRLCLYLWICALFIGILKNVRLMYLKLVEGNPLNNLKEDAITTTGLAADFISAINSLPFKFLWSQKLGSNTSAKFSLVASLIGFYKLF
uniref:Peroxisomal biogenesis factor 11 n=1 Tax=Rhabditophanes sp. KR3021 TaxID=114890 RepID=A0AC35UAB6_9BILA